MYLRADAASLPFADGSFDLVVGSPPYLDARSYGGIKIYKKPEDWVAWMLGVARECLRVSRGPVVFVAAGKTKARNYRPAVEGLVWEWYRSGGHQYAPVYWYRSGIPGGGGDQWYRPDVEHCLCFKRPGALDYADPLANGKPPKYAPGGELSHRLSDGTRRNKWGSNAKTSTPSGRHGKRAPMAPREPLVTKAESPSPAVANPGNLLRVKVGGNHMGHKLAHDNEAPYPVAVPAFFIRSHCPPRGVVLDPFGGSGTTRQAAIEAGRECVVADLRQSQCVLARERCDGLNRGFAFG